ncbi:TonB-dependent receptor [Brevundimonas sp.]|uniref:TonB-dependent receptor n=1 Tax=Brevundimonas sp. TaxID=1871086 RepID=UPI001AD1E34F|nr:TonB-dependent receptor [Brevundimonas sp.]MBN9465157.1 TonB-dependent receptor [Brevundimonas sp.]
MSAVSLTGGAAFAQSATPASATQLDEVVVTATRREQRLQDVPVSVTAVSGEALEKTNFREVSDLQYVAPNVTFSSTNPVSNGGGYQVRGVGTQTYDGGVEQTVGLVVDGVVIGLPRDPGATGFADIERVEVLRGPQGTLFGKNASAGVIQIVSKNPRIGEFSGNVDAAYGERNEQIARGAVNIPLGSTAALRVAGFHSSQDGAIPYVLHSGHVGDRDNQGVRGKLLWQPTDALSLMLTGEYQTGFARDSVIIHQLGTNARYNALFDQFAVKPGPDSYRAYDDGDWTADTTVKGVSLQADYRLGDFTLTSITAYRASEMTQLSDIDHAPINIFNNSDGGLDSHQFTQELRLTSPAGERLEYVAGLFYYKTDIKGWTTQGGDILKFVYNNAAYPPAVLYGERIQSSETESYAAYGQATYALTDQVKLIGGLRYTNDKVDGSLVINPVPGRLVLGAGGMVPYSGQVSADNVSGRAGVQYQPSRNLMFYGTYSTGYKGPAIDSLNGVIKEVRPETVESYEAGVKSTLWNGRWMLNAAVYSSDFKDFQAQALDMTSATPRLGLTNAGLMRARGVELETNLRLTPHLTIGGSASYNDAEYKDYIGSCYTGQPVSPVAGQGCYLQPGTAGVYVANLAGERLANAPKWSYNLRAAYERPVGGGLKIDASTNWSWRDDAYSLTADKASIVGAYGMLNANLGIGAENGSWRLGLYGRNVLDQMFYASVPSLNLLNAFNTGGRERVISPDAFRTIGMKLSVAF